jgi:hypothetical protein
VIYEVENLPKKLSLDLLDRAVAFAADFLSLDVDLLIEFESMKTHQCGFCDYEADEVILTISKRLSVQEMIVTLFHEMIHVKQYADGRLEQGGIWLGKKYECAYDQLPWEIEAHEMERVVMEKFGEI